MLSQIKQVLLAQFEAALSMLKANIELIPESGWNEKIGMGTARQDAYHVLFWVDYYLTDHEDNYFVNQYSSIGGNEMEPIISIGLERPATISYLNYCHERAIAMIDAETEESLAGNSGFPSIFQRRPLSRMELHIYNIRHIQHHAAQLALHLRRNAIESSAELTIPWIGSGWK